jgi:hypothetical protein
MQTRQQRPKGGSNASETCGHVAQEQELDPLAQRYAEEHRRFLEENNPTVLSGQDDPTSYLYSVGSQAAERLGHFMAKYANSPEVQKLPHLARVRALQSRQHELEEIIRDEIICQPRQE